jgi:hypothetical protein
LVGGLVSQLVGWCSWGQLRPLRFRFNYRIGELIHFIIYFREIDSIVKHYSLKLYKRTIDTVAQQDLGSERNLVASIDDNTFASIHIDTGACAHRRHLESAKAFYLHRAISVVKFLIYYIEHCTDKVGSVTKR